MADKHYDKHTTETLQKMVESVRKVDFDPYEKEKKEELFSVYDTMLSQVSK